MEGNMGAGAQVSLIPAYAGRNEWKGEAVIWNVHPKGQRHRILGIVNERSMADARREAEHRFGWVDDEISGLRMHRPVELSMCTTQARRVH